MKVLEKLRHILHRPEVTVRELQDTGAVQVSQKVASQDSLRRRPHYAVTPRPHETCDKACEMHLQRTPARKAPLHEIRAVRKMKHGKQASWYRKSVKANVKPDEENS